MELFVYSRGAIERLPPHDVPHVVISITTTEHDVARLPPTETCRGVLRLVFADVDEASAPEVVLFGRRHADAIWDFIEEHRDSVSRVVLHCDAGISRSPAIAAAIARCFGRDDAEFFRRYRPNMHVYRTMIEAWHDRAAKRAP